MNIVPILSYCNNYAKTNLLHKNKFGQNFTTAFNKVNVLTDTVSFKRNIENDPKDPVLFDGKRFSQLFNGIAKEMFDELNIKILDSKDGYLTISRYGIAWDENSNCIFPMDFGINENELFKYIKAIKGDASFGQSSATCLGNLEDIGGNAKFGDSNIISLGKLKSIGGEADFYYSKVKDIGQLEHVGFTAFVPRSNKSLIQKLKQKEIICRQMPW